MNNLSFHITDITANSIRANASEIGLSVKEQDTRIVIRITAEPGNTFLDRMIAMVEGASRQKTPNEIALGILLVALTIVFIAVVLSLPAMAGYLSLIHI